jgi:LPS-assembly protein
VALSREQATADYAARVPGLTPALLATRLPGLDTRRATGELDWRSTFTSSAGLRFRAVRVGPRRRLQPARHPDRRRHGDPQRQRSPRPGHRRRRHHLSAVQADQGRHVILEPVAQVAASPNAKQVVIGHDRRPARRST